eukprot:424314_1
MAGSLNKYGKRYADRSKSSIISFLLNEDSDNYRRQLESKGIKPKNHHKQNLKNISNIQELAKQQKENKIKQANIKPKKAAKYLKIDSKLKQTLSSNPSTSISHDTNTNFIKKNMCTIKSQSSLNASMAKNRIHTQRKPAIPKQQKLNTFKHEEVEEKDFVTLNKNKLQDQTIKNANNNAIRFVNKKDYGKVPDYIIQRKLEAVELEQKKMEEEEARKIPDGMRIMTEEERSETLKLLQQNKLKLIDSIKMLPLVIETPSMKKYESNLNKQLTEIEKTIIIFQKPTVFVAMNE